LEVQASRHRSGQLHSTTIHAFVQMIALLDTGALEPDNCIQQGCANTLQLQHASSIDLQRVIPQRLTLCAIHGTICLQTSKSSISFDCKEELDNRHHRMTNISVN